MMNCKLSVVVPVYNVEQYLDRCVRSILTQTFSDFELILVDDGSPDKCPRMCDKWADKDSRIKVIHQKNGGLVAAVKHGIELANAEFIAFVDSDDWVAPTFLQVLYEGIVENCADVAQCNFQRVEENETYTHISPPRIFEGKEEIKRELLKPMADASIPDQIPGMNGFRCSKIYRADILREAMPFYDPAVSISEDFLLNFAVFGLCKKIVVLDTLPLYSYCFNPSSIMTDYAKEKMLNMDAFCEKMEKLSEIYGCTTGDAAFRKNQYFVRHIHKRALSEQSRAVRKEEIQTIIAALDRKAWFQSIKTMKTFTDKVGMYLYYFGLIDLALILTDLSKLVREWCGKKEKIMGESHGKA